MTTLDISPEAQRAIARVDTFLDGIAPDRQDLALLGLECMAFASTDRPLPEHLKSAQLGAAYEHARQRSIADAVIARIQERIPARLGASETAPHTDDPTITLIDDGERSGVRVERYDQHERGETPNGWLDFRVGSDGDTERVLVSAYIYGADRPGLELIINDKSINDHLDDTWTLDNLRQLRDDLDRLLRDERLAGVLAEQAV